MGQTEKAMHKMLSEHEKTLKGYVDPWGARGGLFGSILILFALVMSFYVDGIDVLELGVICVVIMLFGYGVSHLQGLINMFGAMNDINSKTIIMLHETIRKQKEIIKNLEGRDEQ